MVPDQQFKQGSRKNCLLIWNQAFELLPGLIESQVVPPHIVPKFSNGARGVSITRGPHASVHGSVDAAIEHVDLKTL